MHARSRLLSGLFLAATILLGAPGPGVAAAEDPWPAIRADFLAGHLASAVTRLERLIADQPNNREAHYYMGMIRWRQGEIALAAASYREVWRLDPEGPFGKDAKLWLDAHASRGAIAPVPVEATPTPAPARPAVIAIKPPPRPKPTPRMTTVVVPFKPRPTPAAQASVVMVPRSRSAKPRAGYFKAADGSFEFKPPSGFALLDEGVKAEEGFTLFGVPGASPAPPTLLVTWRAQPELLPLKPDQRVARERQLLHAEASAYGPDGQPGAYAGGPCMRIKQVQGGWTAETLLFIQHGRLYAMTYGGDKALVAQHRTAVNASWKTPIFYP